MKMISVHAYAGVCIVCLYCVLLLVFAKCIAGRFISIHVLDIIKKGEIVGRGSLSSINEEQF